MGGGAGDRPLYRRSNPNSFVDPKESSSGLGPFAVKSRQVTAQGAGNLHDFESEVL